MRKKTKIKPENYKDFLENILKIMPTVASILKKDLETRDDDNILISKVWEHQGAKSHYTFEKIKEMLYLGKIATPETITRSRRKLMEKHVELRGKLYNERHQYEKLFSKQIKMNLE
ncbi:MAG TPA: hypothetical protein VN026_08405 [Bacteroidia bacterium]|jgi:hypothetical protein|nr:hypothetical protein [Bacteroidia bacterium]